MIYKKPSTPNSKLLNKTASSLSITSSNNDNIIPSSRMFSKPITEETVEEKLTKLSITYDPLSNRINLDAFNDELTKDNFKLQLKKSFQIIITSDELDLIFDKIDTNHDNIITGIEFKKYFFELKKKHNKEIEIKQQIIKKNNDENINRFQEIVDKQLKSSQYINIPLKENFPYKEHHSYTWSIAVMIKYLIEKIELSQYIDLFNKAEIDGYGFICMDESILTNTLKIQNVIHICKLASHALMLRTYVLEKASLDFPDILVQDWSSIHLSAWLYYEHSLPDTSLAVLRAKYTGFQLFGSSGKKTLQAINAGGIKESKEAEEVLDRFITTLVYVDKSKDNKHKKLSKKKQYLDSTATTNDNEFDLEHKPKAKAAMKTAMSKRRSKKSNASLSEEPTTTTTITNTNKHSSIYCDGDSDSEDNVDSIDTNTYKKTTTATSSSSATNATPAMLYNKSNRSLDVIPETSSIDDSKEHDLDDEGQAIKQLQAQQRSNKIVGNKKKKVVADDEEDSDINIDTKRKQKNISLFSSNNANQNNTTTNSNNNSNNSTSTNNMIKKISQHIFEDQKPSNQQSSSEDNKNDSNKKKIILDKPKASKHPLYQMKSKHNESSGENNNGSDDEEEMDFYSKSVDRKEFLTQIMNLKQVISNHAKQMKELNDHAMMLRRENESIKNKQKKMLLQDSVPNQMITTLIEDRNMVITELGQVVGLFKQQAFHEQQEAKATIKELLDSTVKSQLEHQQHHKVIGAAHTQNHQQQQQQVQQAILNAKPYHLDSNLFDNNRIPIKATQTTSPRTVLYTNTDDGSSRTNSGYNNNNSNNNITFNNTNSIIDRARNSQIEANKQQLLKETDTAISGTSNSTMQASQSQVISSNTMINNNNNNNTTSTPSLLRVRTNSNSDSSGSDLDDRCDLRMRNTSNSSSRNKIALSTTPTKIETMSTEILNGNPIQIVKSNILTSNEKDPPNDLLRVVNNTAIIESTLWSQVLQSYKLTRSHVHDHISDNKILLHNIAIRWVRLGLKIVQDAHDQSIEKPIRKCLKGLEKCSQTILLTSPNIRGKKHIYKDNNNSHAATTTTTTNNNNNNNNNNNTMKSKSTAFPVQEYTSNTINSNTSVDGKEGSLYCHRKYTAQHLQYIATCTVFSLAGIHRLFHRYSNNDDKTQLLYLLNKTKHGELPIIELSRDNLHDFLDIVLGMDLKWERFDSVCHLLDPDKNGFIDAYSMIKSFELLTPLEDKIYANDAQIANMLLLSITTNTLAIPKQSISETLLSLLIHNVQENPSFHKYIKQEQKRLRKEDEMIVSKPATINDNANNVIDNSNSSIDDQTKKKLLISDTKVAEEQQFVCDILYELSKEFIHKCQTYQDSDPQYTSHATGIIINTKDSKKLFKDCMKRIGCQQLVHKHTESCHVIARSLQIYLDTSNSNQQLISNITTLFISYLKFRRYCLEYLLNNNIIDNNNNTTLQSPVKTNNNTIINNIELVNHNNKYNMKLSYGQIQEILLEINENLKTLLGDNYNKDENIKLSPTQYEQIMCELFGIPLPYHSHSYITITHNNNNNNNNNSSSSNKQSSTITTSMISLPLIYIQCQVESILYHTKYHFSLEQNAIMLSDNVTKKSLANHQALKDIQKQIHSKLWDANQESPKKNVTSSAINNYIPPPPLFQVVSDVNKLMYQQRIDQANSCIEMLNNKAIKKKKAIKLLMNLWQATKQVLLHKNKNDTSNSETDIRLLAMPVNDIISQTRSIQQQLVDDMQQHVSTKDEQLINRVNLLRYGLKHKTIPDDDGALVAILKEITLLEDSLLQANSDGMRLCSRILKQFTS